jgi:exonuclease SbcC
MILKGLRIENVKCFESLDLTFVPGKNVIIGHNGSGKSTILQSILYSLFHEYPQGKVDGLIRHGERAAEFTMEFEHEGRQYLIERTLRRSGKQDAQLSEVGLSGSLADTQTGVTQAVSETLQTRKEVFRDVILVRQGEIAQIVDMSSSDRKILFDKLLGIHDYEQAWSQCRLLKKTLENKLRESEEIMKAHEPIADKLPERKAELKKRKEELKEKREQLSRSKRELRGVKVKWSALDILNDQIGTLDTQIKPLESNLRKTREKEKGQRTKFDGLCFKLEIVPLARLATLLTRLGKEQLKIKRDIKSKRGDHQTLLDKMGKLTNYLEREEELQNEIVDLDKEISRTESDSLSRFPDLKTIDYEDWPEKVTQELKTQGTRLNAVRTELKKVERVQGSINTLSMKAEGHQEAVTKLQARISKNEKAAESVGRDDWRSIAKRSKVKIQKQLEKVIMRLKESEVKERRLTKAVSRAETDVDRLKKELSGLASLVGKKCPKCKQIVDEDHAVELKSEIGAELTQATDLLTDSKKKHKQAKESLESLRKEEKDLDKTLSLMEKLNIYLATEVECTRDIRGTNLKLMKIQSNLAVKEDELDKYDTSGLKEEEESLDSWCDTLRGLKGEVGAFLKDIKKKQETDGALGIVRREIQKLQTLSLDRKIPALKEQIDSMDERKERLNILKELTGKMASLEEQIGGWETELKQKNRKLGQAKKQFDQKRYKELTARHNELRDYVVELDTEIRQLKGHRIPDAQEAFDESKTSAEAIEQKREDHERTTRALEVLATVREFYREVQIPLRVRDVRRASSHATEVFKSLMGTNEFDRIVITDNHDLLISRFGELEPMRALSGGEQVLAALAVRMGFAKALVGSDLLILDEPTAYLDDTRRAELVQTLTYASPAKQMLIVTHDDDFKSVAQKIIRVQKDDSTLVSNVSIGE